jgi:hypothetical protein
MAAKATTSSQLLANFHRRTCTGASSAFPDVRPTAIEASTPRTAAPYNHASLSGIIETMSPRAMTNGDHAISREERIPVCSVVDIFENGEY